MAYRVDSPALCRTDLHRLSRRGFFVRVHFMVRKYIHFQNMFLIICDLFKSHLVCGGYTTNGIFDRTHPWDNWVTRFQFLFHIKETLFRKSTKKAPIFSCVESHRSYLYADCRVFTSVLSEERKKKSRSFSFLIYCHEFPSHSCRAFKTRIDMYVNDVDWVIFQNLWLFSYFFVVVHSTIWMYGAWFYIAENIFKLIGIAY